MKSSTEQIENTQLAVSYRNAWNNYQNGVVQTGFIGWDYVILTASNEEQASSYRLQLQYRFDNGFLPPKSKYIVIPDPGGKRVGSGGATLHVLNSFVDLVKSGSENPFNGKRILVIHCGGDSKRIPQYSVCGKIFSPVPRILPNGYPSSLFDELLILMSYLPSKINDGMLVLSGDILFLFDAQQVDASFGDAAAISVKGSVQTGRNHGVFFSRDNKNVTAFLHKKSEAYLRANDVLDKSGQIDLDTGAVLLSCKVLNSLYALICTDNEPDIEKRAQFINEDVRLNFYGDFLYPLAADSRLEQYYKENSELTGSKALHDCRTAIWESLHPYSLELIRVSPSKFFHFGTTKELLKMVTKEIGSFGYIGWERHIATNAKKESKYTSIASYISDDAIIADNCYIENSYIGRGTKIEEESIVSETAIEGGYIPSHVVVHSLKLLDGRFCVRTYGIGDNSKGTYEQRAAFLKTNLGDFIDKNNIPINSIWNGDEHSLWEAKLFPVCFKIVDCLHMNHIIYLMSDYSASSEDVDRWKNAEKLSLKESFAQADNNHQLLWKKHLKNLLYSRESAADTADLAEQ